MEGADPNGVVRGALRNRPGPEPSMGASLAAGATVVVLDGLVPQLDVLLSERSLSRVYRRGPSRQRPNGPAWQQTTFVPRCLGLMPWAPAHHAGARAAGGDLTITWVRRTRFGAASADGGAWGPWLRPSLILGSLQVPDVQNPPAEWDTG